jgi:23S rRNA (pseudouridine1915-N3)-methyltransferase
LARDWAQRATAAGRPLGVSPVSIIEVDARRGSEAQALSERLDHDLVVACDEHGDLLASRTLALRIGAWRDDGLRSLAFVIGGADGLGPVILQRAGSTIAFGPQTWPHALARAMLAEQVYRAMTILAGAPYHRD